MNYFTGEGMTMPDSNTFDPNALDPNTITIVITLDVAKVKLYHAAHLVNELELLVHRESSEIHNYRQAAALKCARMELEDACVAYVQAFMNETNRKKSEEVTP